MVQFLYESLFGTTTVWVGYLQTWRPRKRSTVLRTDQLYSSEFPMPLTCEEATCMPICVHLLSYFYKVVAESQATASPAKSCLPGLQCESIAPVYRLMAFPLKLYYCQTILFCFSGNTFFFLTARHTYDWVFLMT